MTFFDVLALLGGLALFLFGMQVMGDGLKRVSGSKLENILERLTSTPLRGVLLGAGVTAVIQSSSATTVMVVGFVNSGIMQLKQVVGIIMGANLGTTVTAWILSLTGIEGSGFLVQMCKPTSFSPILAFIGVMLLLFSKKDKAKDIGTIFLGFTILMYGMNFMSGAVSPLAESTAFADLLVKFSNPLLGLLAGLIITAVLQSSSASVGILQALALTGILPFSAAVPIIMGQNIGTCVTALLSCIGTSINAKRAAFIHLFFNVFGTVIFLVLFYLGMAIFDFGFMSENITVSQIAIVHTTFNVVATCCLLPFSGLLEKLAVKLVRGKQNEEKQSSSHALMPEERFLTTPSFGVEHARRILAVMMDSVRHNVLTAVKLCADFQDDDYEDLQNGEKLVNEYEHRLSDYLIRLSKADLSEQDALVVGRMLSAISDVERISDHALNAGNTAKELAQSDECYSKWGQAELAVYNSAILDITDRAFHAFNEKDQDLAKTIRPLHAVIDGMRDELKLRHIQRLQKGNCTVNLGLHFIDTLNFFERIAAYNTNLAEYVIQIGNEKFDGHRYLKTISDDDRALYRQIYEENQTKYKLPIE